MKEKFIRFMQGRYGSDQLSKFLMIIAVVLMLISMFSRINIFYGISLFILVIIYVRMFSRNIPKRYSENQIYMNYHNKVKVFFMKKKSLWEQKKTYHIYKCPSCKQKIRVPKGRGKIEINCSKCHTTFVKKS